MAPPVPEVGTVPLALLLLLVLLVSAFLVAVMIGYARRRGLLDHPGQRRLHRQPTPRGGGAGIVLALLVGLPLLALTTGVAVPAHGLLLWWLALLLTALLGARDDHGGLGIAPRLTGHLLAGALLAASLWPWLAAALGWPLVAVAAGLLVLATAWSINLHNFMDGSDGLLAAQALLVALGLALLAGSAHAVALRATALLLAAAVAGFAPFNLPLPRARVFMGDVGSGALGFMLAALALTGVVQGVWPLPAALLLCSAFIADASVTLLWRMLRGRRWWRPHREHLYQWLARAHRSHRLPLLTYLLWNLLLALPLAVLAARDATLGWWLVAGLYMLAGVLWWWGKSACRAALRSNGIRHASV